MKKLAIKAENISKQYKLGEVGTGTLRNDLNRFWSKVRGKEDPYLKIGEVNDRSLKGQSDYVWALKNINFEIEQGDAVGIIGRNGAGKSTLLKLLSKVTQPTTGSFRVKGRIASLLEVGTGFNQEMTGRENIYLNGAILGMRRQEIKRKFDEIVAFSGVEKYIDTPVKRYSSGMYVRLAFAVAAHLESEILIVDEVLSVGDAEFQKKCLGKMDDVSKGEGRTILFVSHNISAVKTFCKKGILLNNGLIEYQGDVDSCVNLYQRRDSLQQCNLEKFTNIGVKNIFKLESIHVYNTYKSSNDTIVESEEISLTTSFQFLRDDIENYYFKYHLHNASGEPLFTFSHANKLRLKKGSNEVTCLFPKNFLQLGTYYLSLFFVENPLRNILIQKDIFSFRVDEGLRELGAYMGKEPGSIRPEFEWKS